MPATNDTRSVEEHATSDAAVAHSTADDANAAGLAALSLDAKTSDSTADKSEPSVSSSSSPSAAAATAGVAASSAAVTAPTAAAAAAASSPTAAAPSSAAGGSGDLLAGGYKRGGAENDPDTGYYDEVDLDDFEYDESSGEFSYPCPCGDRFRITRADLLEGEDIARCPSCSLLLKVIYDPEELEDE